tara:strand:- start:272 stop:685 length:414 start_codon:yes stop_codon:yes gene_type:complete
MKRILFLIICFISFSIHAKPLSILCKGILNWSTIYTDYTREDALLEIYIQDSTKWQSNLRTLNNYIIMPKSNRFNAGYADKHFIKEFYPSSNEYKIGIQLGFLKTNVVIQRKTGRINLKGPSHEFDGVCEDALENKF